MKLTSSFPPDVRGQLQLAGVPAQTLYAKPFVVAKSLVLVKYDMLDGRPKFIRKDKQLESLARVYEDPVHAPYVLGLSSLPNDEMAKRVAVEIMVRALGLGIDAYWSSIYGTFKNELRDRKRTKPQLLVLSNVLFESTPQKLELCRDILEMYSQIPRIVVTSGADALTLFNQKLHYTVNYCAHMMPKPYEREEDDDEG